MIDRIFSDFEAGWRSLLCRARSNVEPTQHYVGRDANR
jgi:hypothetical protein